MQDLFEVRNLQKSYKDFSLKNISFSVPAGAIMGLVGINGAGKTTLIKSILGIVKPDFGEVFLFGKAFGDGENSDIGIVTDDNSFDEHWRIFEAKKICRLFINGWDDDKFDGLIERFGIAQNKKIKELSRGMNVKFMIAVALSHDAKLLILDEPTSGLDPVARADICNLLSDFVSQGNKSVLFSTHITEDLEKIANYLTFVHNGEIVLSDTKEAIVDKMNNVANLSLVSLSDLVLYISAGGDL